MSTEDKTDRFFDHELDPKQEDEYLEELVRDERQLADFKERLKLESVLKRRQRQKDLAQIQAWQREARRSRVLFVLLIIVVLAIMALFVYQLLSSTKKNNEQAQIIAFYEATRPLDLSGTMLPEPSTSENSAANIGHLRKSAYDNFDAENFSSARNQFEQLIVREPLLRTEAQWMILLCDLMTSDGDRDPELLNRLEQLIEDLPGGRFRETALELQRYLQDRAHVSE